MKIKLSIDSDQHKTSELKHSIMFFTEQRYAAIVEWLSVKQTQLCEQTIVERQQESTAIPAVLPLAELLLPSPADWCLNTPPISFLPHLSMKFIIDHSTLTPQLRNNLGAVLVTGHISGTLQSGQAELSIILFSLLNNK